VLTGHSKVLGGPYVARGTDVAQACCKAVKKTTAKNVDEIDTCFRFHQCLRAAFCLRKYRKHKRQSSHQCLFKFSGSACSKAARNMLVKLAPGRP